MDFDFYYTEEQEEFRKKMRAFIEEHAYKKPIVPADIRVDSLNDYQAGELKRFKDWLYQKRIRIRLDRERAERRQKEEEETTKREAEQPALFDL